MGASQGRLGVECSRYLGSPSPPPHLPTQPPPAPAGAGTGEEEEEGESVHYLPRRWKEPCSPCQELALAKNTGKVLSMLSSSEKGDCVGL